jgi:hypothetical protein
MLIVAAALAPAAAGTVRTGLHGFVLRGPAMPVCPAMGPSCSVPVPHLRLTFSRDGASKTVTTDANGHYAIALAGGTYSVQMAVPRRYGPTRVVVVAGRSRLQNFEIDTGIR